MKRREFIAGLGGAASWSFGASAQRALLKIGYLYSETQDSARELVGAFQQGLRDMGYVDGRNVTFEYRWGDSHNDRLPALALELVRREVAMIITIGTPATLAAKGATATVPILFFNGADPVRTGLVASLARPGGNVTGITNLAGGLTAKRLELLHALVPATTSIALLRNPDNNQGSVTEAQTAARTLGIHLLVVNARSGDEIAAAFQSPVVQQAGALLVAADPFYLTQIDQLVALAARHRIPASYEFRLFAAAGGLMSYGTDLLNAHRQIGFYAGRILKGEKPADLPVQQVTKVELVINMKTAKALGIAFPLTLLGRADEVIE